MRSQGLDRHLASAQAFPSHIDDTRPLITNCLLVYFFFQAEDGIRDHCVTGVQTCALPIYLQQLLASYFPRYRAAAEATGRSRRPVAVDASDLVIRTGGHARAFFGVAYLPGQMPSGVRAEQIR